MRKNAIAAAVGLATLTVPGARALEFDFASVGNSQLQFTGATHLNHSSQSATFTLLASTLNDASKGFDFQINNTRLDPSHPTAIGDKGILSGQFAVTGYTDTTFVLPSGVLHVEKATVTDIGTPVLMIMDPGYNAALGISAPANASHIFEATPTFDTITQVYTVQHNGHLAWSADGISSVNAPVSQNLTLNLSAGHYTGREEDLIALASQQGQIQLGWSWNTRTLGSMLALNAGRHKVSLEGSIQSTANVPDQGNTVWLMGLALFGLVYAGRRAGWRAA